MLLEKIPSVKLNNLDEIHVLIEIPMNDLPVKYEFDKEAGCLFVDRVMPTSMSYPCNYGFIPNTLSEDGDPCDVLVIAQYPLIAGSVIKCRPVAVLLMEDESGKDEKIIAVPADKIDPFYKNIRDLEDISEYLRNKIKHFFEHYKALEKGKWVKVEKWGDASKAKELIEKSCKRFSQ